MQWLKNLWARRPPRIWLIIVTLVLVFAGLIFFDQQQAGTDKGVRQTYSRQLSQLGKASHELPSVIEAKNSPKDSLSRYFDQLNALLEPCGVLSSAYDKRSASIKDQSTKDSMNKVQKLCKDLNDVVKYSQSLYAACQDYIYFGRDWPDVQDSHYLSDLQDLIEVLGSTKSRLGHVDNTAIQDPALHELTEQVDDASQQAQQIQTAIEKKDFKQAGILSDSLIKQINKDKEDFLNARSYYWNNTIGLSDLQTAVDKLKAEFK